MNTPIIIKISAAHLDEFINCEMGAHEDKITGPSPLTTVTILRRHEAPVLKRTVKRRAFIECQTVEEAAQVLDCCRYGTFPIHCPRIADRIYDDLHAIPEVRDLWYKHDREQWNDLGELVRETLKITP
jgi:hypothetical protein